MRILAAVSKAFLAAALVIVILSFASGLLLTRERLTEVLQDAFTSGTLSSNPSNPDYVEDWVECSLLTMEYARYESALDDAFATRWIRPTHHTCDELQALVSGPPFKMQLSSPTLYPNYAFGARHLEAIPLSVLRFSTAQRLCLFLTYASIAVLLVAGWRNSPRQTIAVLVPTAFFLAFAFQQHRYGNNLMWAPSFIVGIFLLALLIGAPVWFRSKANRVGLFCFLALIASFLDTMQGSLPVLLSLSIVLNHFFYVAGGNYPSAASYWRTAVQEALTVVACFVLCYAAFTGLRLLIVSGLGVDQSFSVFQFFIGGLNQRMGTEVPGVGTVHLSDVAKRLWEERAQLTGNALSTWLLGASACAWLAAIVLLAAFFRRSTAAASRLATDIFVLAMAGLGIVSWYIAFPNHSYIHAWLMVRMMALPAAYGFVAALLLLLAWLERLGLRRVAAAQG